MPNPRWPRGWKGPCGIEVEAQFPIPGDDSAVRVLILECDCAVQPQEGILCANQITFPEMRTAGTVTDGSRKYCGNPFIWRHVGSVKQPEQELKDPF